MKSLSAKIIAAAVTLITVSYVADFLIASNINKTLNTETEMLTTRMGDAIGEKDRLIKSLLEENLHSAERTLQAVHTEATATNTLETEQTRAFLEGTRNGIATSSVTLISNAMLMGEAATAQEMMEVLLENPDIFAINLWRTTGDMAFRDNATIKEINDLAGAEMFAPRDPLDKIVLEGPRRDVLDQVVATRQSGLIATGEEENDDGEMEPVEYAYYLLENADECQGCHGDTTKPRGVLEVAVSRQALIDLESGAMAKIQAMEAEQASEQTKLEEENAAKAGQVEVLTEQVNADVATGRQHVADAQDSAFVTSLLSKGGFFLLTVGVLFWVLNTLLTKPVHAMTDAMDRLAHGDLDAEVPEVGREDEIGQMAAAVQVFKDNAIEVKRLEAEQAEQGRIAEEKKRQMMLVMANDFETSVGGVVETVSTAASQMQNSASMLSSNAEQTSNLSSNVAASSEEASTNVQTVASAAEELSSSISEISRQVSESTRIAGDAVVEVEGANAKVQSLDEAAQRIGEVVAMITDIADQTNLLALNATIEAARAGEAGKGFAVVASEVKNLANQTGKATEDIANQVSGIQLATQEAVEAISSIGATINRVNEITSAIAAAVEEQGAATQEIARNVEQAAAGTGEVSHNISSVNQAASETGASAEQLLNSASELSDQADVLHREVDRFLTNIRADATGEEVDFFPWTDEMLIGVEFQDREHKKLVQMINDLYRAVKQGRTREKLGEILEGLALYTVEHFGNEEEAMDKYGYPDSVDHKAQHAALIENVHNFVTEFNAGDSEIGPELMGFLRTWLADHILQTDKQMAKWLNANT